MKKTVAEYMVLFDLRVDEIQIVCDGVYIDRRKNIGRIVKNVTYILSNDTLVVFEVE